MYVCVYTQSRYVSVLTDETMPGKVSFIHANSLLNPREKRPLIESNNNGTASLINKRRNFAFVRPSPPPLPSSMNGDLKF